MQSYMVPKVVNQYRHVEGTPFGTRGGIAVTHNFPADGDYVFKLQLYYWYTGELVGSKLMQSCRVRKSKSRSTANACQSSKSIRRFRKLKVTSIRSRLP